MSRFYLQTDSQENMLKKRKYHSELSINNIIISKFMKKKILQHQVKLVWYSEECYTNH